MGMLCERATRAAAAAAVLLALGCAASLSTHPPTAASHRDDRRAVDSLAFRIDAATLRHHRPGLRPAVGRDGQRAWRVPAAAGAVVALLAAVPWRRGRRPAPEKGDRGHRLPPRQGSRAPPAAQPG